METAVKIVQQVVGRLSPTDYGMIFTHHETYTTHWKVFR